MCEHDRRLKPLRKVHPQIHTQRIGTVQMAHQAVAHHLVQRQGLRLQHLLCLLRQGQGQQLVDQMAGPRLALRNAAQLFAPDLGVGLRQAVFGQGLDARQGCAQFVRHIARKLFLPAHALVDAVEQGVDRFAQFLHIQRAGGDRHWRQVAHIALCHRLLQVHQGLDVFLNGTAQPPSQPDHEQQLRHQRDEQEPLKQAVLHPCGLRHHHREFGWFAALQHHRSQTAVLKRCFGEKRRRRRSRPHRQLQTRVPGQQTAIVLVHRKVQILVLVKQQIAHLDRTQAQGQAAVFGMAHMAGHGISVVQQGAVKGLLREIPRHRQCQHGPHQPGQGQWHDHMPQQLGTQSGCGFHARSSSMR